MALSLLKSLIFLFHFTESKWFGHRYPMAPKPDSQSAVGVHNKSIYIIGSLSLYFHQFAAHSISTQSVYPPPGGHQFPSQVTKFDTERRKFQELPDIPGDVKIYGHGSFYTQFGFKLFIIMPEEDTISMFDLETSEFTNHWENTKIPEKVFKNGCLTATDTHLFILGGGHREEPSHTVQMLSLDDYLWIYNVPHMNTRRNRFSCAVDNNNVLYAIAGWGSVQSQHHSRKSKGGQLKWLSSIEMIQTNHILKNSWKHVGNLRAPAGMTRVVHRPREQQIWILGGMYTVGRSPVLYIDHALVHVIFTENRTVHLMPDRLPYGVMDVSAVLVDDTIFGFGGYDGRFITSWFTDKNVFKKETKKDDLEWLWISFLVLTVVIGMYTLWRVYLNQKREQEDESKERETKMVEMIGSFDDDEEMGFLTTK